MNTNTPSCSYRARFGRCSDACIIQGVFCAERRAEQRRENISELTVGIVMMVLLGLVAMI